MRGLFTRANLPIFPFIMFSGCVNGVFVVLGSFRSVIFSYFALLADRGKGVPSFDERMDIALVEVDFDDPTTNVRGRIAIAKPTPRGY